jgi:hypothetical protein
VKVNETSWTRRINDKLKCWKWKIHTTTRSGIPDCLYIGREKTLWVEYKYLPHKVDTVHPVRQLTPLQKKNLRALYSLNQTVWVILKVPKGFLIAKGLDWERPLTTDNVLTIDEVVQAIENEVDPCIPSHSLDSSSSVSSS